MSSKQKLMKYSAKHGGKWVAIQGDKVIADAKSLTRVVNKVKDKDPESIRFSLVPKGFIAG